jgi:hypothetical protein
MGKARTDKRGFTREQRLHEENQQLKRQVSSLRKQLARLDLDRFGVVQEMIEEHYQEERAEQGQEILKSLRKTWACHNCADGTMEIFVYNRGDRTMYYRICSNAPFCLNRTLPQSYHPGIKGIIRKDKS